MSKILYLYDNNMPTVSMMKEELNRDKADYPYESEIASVREVNTEQLNNADVIVLVRPTEYLSHSIAKWSRKRDKFLVVFCDDDLYNGVQDSLINKSRVKFFRKTIVLADLLWTCSPRIAEKYRDLVRMKQCLVTNTIVEPDDIYPHNGGNEKVKIVYAAGAGHSSLFEKNISPIVQKLYDSLGRIFTVTFVGVRPDVPVSAENRDLISYLPFMSLEEYRSFMRDENFDIGVAPLNTDEFSKCKYFNKFFEYAMFGIAGLYSNTEPYTYVISDKENGLLVKNGPDNWYNAIREAIEDQNLRNRISLHSQQTLRDRFYPEANDNEIRQFIPVKVDSDNKPIVGDFQLNASRLIYVVYSNYLYGITALEHLVSEGPVALFRKIVDHKKNKKTFG